MDLVEHKTRHLPIQNTNLELLQADRVPVLGPCHFFPVIPGAIRIVCNLDGKLQMMMFPCTCYPWCQRLEVWEDLSNMSERVATSQHNIACCSAASLTSVAAHILRMALTAIKTQYLDPVTTKAITKISAVQIYLMFIQKGFRKIRLKIFPKLKCSQTLYYIHLHL